MSSKHPIDALFEKELKEHQSSPNEAVWEKIAANQQGTKPKREGIFFLRAASVLLLVGLSSFWYLNRHSGDIGIQPSNAQQEFVAGPDDKPENNTDEPENTQTKEPKNAKAKASKTEPKQKVKKANSKKGTARVIPILQQKISDPVLALNDLNSIDLEENLEGVETIDDPDVLKIRVNLSDIKGDYQTNPKAKKDLRQRMWAYASSQYERVKAGEGLELPNTDDAKIEIPLPDFINRRFSKWWNF